MTRSRRTFGIAMAIAAAALACGILSGRPVPSLSREEAAALLVETVLPQLPLTDSYVAFLYDEALDARDDLAPYLPVLPGGDVTSAPYLMDYRIKDRTWFAWIDLDPYAKYAHPTLFVLIDAANGTFTVHQEAWWPVLNGSSMWVDDDAYWDEDGWIASAGTHGRAITTPRDREFDAGWIGGDPFDWFLLVNGWAPGEANETEFRTDIGRMRDAAAGLGMRVTTLDAGEATPAALEAEIERLFTEIPLYRCCDRLYIYLTCHASPELLWIGGRPLSAQELARVLTLPGSTYVPSRVYVLLDTGFGGSFVPALSPHGNITRVWTASAADEPAYADVDTPRDPNPHDGGSEWTSSFLAALADLLAQDGYAAESVELGRFYMAINPAMSASAQWNAAEIEGRSRPAHYLITDKDRDALCACVEYLAAWDRELRRSAGTLEETIARHQDDPCGVFFRFLYNMARHDALIPPMGEFHLGSGKSCARDVAHSDWHDLCHLYWEVFTAPVDGAGTAP
ncbi:MAG: hypothetical protein JSW65_07160 [Candidatus Bipolaricaulota bacterium]|nr:MAG: hypothetical protein JSW65_07160 [Candidatus Bipolaricaulota bacterium]